MLLSEFNYKAKTDDIYNLSLRRSALRLCREILDNLALLEKLYIGAPGSGVYNRYMSFVRQNRQIALIVQKFNRTLSAKDILPAACTKGGKNKGLTRAKKTLVLTISDILTLSSVTENGFMLNKFMLCCNCLSKQLLFLYNV